MLSAMSASTSEKPGWRVRQRCVDTFEDIDQASIITDGQLTRDYRQIKRKSTAGSPLAPSYPRRAQEPTPLPEARLQCKPSPRARGVKWAAARGHLCALNVWPARIVLLHRNTNSPEKA